MNKYLWIAVPVAGALGYVVGEIDISEAKAARRTITHQVQVDLTEQRGDAFEHALGNIMCPKVVEDLGIEAEQCTGARIVARAQGGVCYFKQQSDEGVKRVIASQLSIPANIVMELPE